MAKSIPAKSKNLTGKAPGKTPKRTIEPVEKAGAAKSYVGGDPLNTVISNFPKKTKRPLPAV